MNHRIAGVQRNRLVLGSLQQSKEPNVDRKIGFTVLTTYLHPG